MEHTHKQQSYQELGHNPMNLSDLYIYTSVCVMVYAVFTVGAVAPNHDETRKTGRICSAIKWAQLEVSQSTTSSHQH